MLCEDLQRTAGSCGSLGSPCPLALISGVISKGSMPWATAPGAALMEELPSPAAVVSWDAGEGHAGRKKSVEQVIQKCGMFTNLVLILLKKL